MCGQIVLCRGVNDGEELARSLRDLAELYPAMGSVAVVPAGLTKFRDKLYPLTDFTYEEAAQIIASSGESIRSELETIKGAISGVINSVTAAAGAFMNLPLLPENVKNEYGDCLDYLKSVKDKITAIVSDGVTSDEIEELADEAKDKAEQILERINEDLTDAEKETVKSISETLEATLTGIKNNLSSALETAENEAKRYIEQKRNQRVNKDAE
jgi:NifB/MoaA-like Fe-S oxidoreductase